MPRTARSVRAGICYHVINRGNARATVFHDAYDYQAFAALASESTRRVGMEVLAFCLMPNHFHFVLRPATDDSLSKWVHWLMTTHVHRYRLRYASVGHLWQGRFKAFPIQDDAHLFAVMRYVERNALRAGLVPRADEWPWGSLAHRERHLTCPLVNTPLPLPPEWNARVNAADSVIDLNVIRRCVARGTPYGDAVWTRAAADELGLEHTLRPPGRPRKTELDVA